ncbi:MAG TPA: ABC transporter substrate-binding protein/permease [Polyangia bacterium]
MWWLGALALAFLVAALPGEGRAATLGEVRARGVLRWGGDLQGGAPYVSESASRPGELDGFEVDIAAGLAKRLGVRSQFVQTDWSTLVAALERGSIDVILNGLEVIESRRAQVRFTRPYFVFAERLSVRSDDQRAAAWTTGAGLGIVRGLRVGTLTNSYAWELLGDAGATRIPFEGQEEPYRDLASGRLDAVLMDDIIADRYGQKPGLRVVGDFASGQYAIGLRPADTELATAVDEALGALIASGELRAILRAHGLDGPRQAGLEQSASGRVTTAPAVPGRKPRGLDAQQVQLFLAGAGVTLLVSVGAMVVAMLLGLGLALLRLPGRAPRAAAVAATVYIEIFRGTPVLLQLYVLYYGLAPIYPLPPLLAAIVGLGLNYAAYEAEIYRAGFAAVPRGQIEAAEALGMSAGQVLRRVSLPQALRHSLPGIANDFIALLKDSSLVSVITVVELTKRMTIAAVDGGGWLLPGLLCAALYLVMSLPLSRLLRRLESRVGARG